MGSVKALTKPRQSESWFSWFIAVSCMIVISGTFGIFRSSGVIFAEVIHAFHVDRELASWPFAVSAILNSFSGIVCGPLTAVLPVRVIVILGICLSAFGLGMCSFTSGILWMTVGYGFIFGFGTGLTYVCLPLVINDYFKKNKSTGNGILLAGTPLGVTVLAPITEVLITTYALSGTFLFLSAICVQTLVFAALMRPATPPPVEECDVPDNCKHYEKVAEEPEITNGDSNDQEHSLMLYVKDPSRISYSGSEKNLKQPCPNDINELNVLVKYSLKADSTEFGYIEKFEHLTSQEIDIVSPEVISTNCDLITSCSREDNTCIIHADGVSHAKGPRGRFLYLTKIFKLLKNPTFALMTFNFMVTMSAIQIVTNVLVDYAEDKGFSRESAVMVFTVNSVAEFFSRVCSGWILDKGFVRKDYLLIISQTMCGAIVFLISIVYGKIALCVVLALFGSFSSVLLVLFNVFCADNFQKEQLGFVFGIRQASMIIICFVRPWIIGIFRDSIGSYDYLFRSVGVLVALSSFLWTFTLCKKKKPTVTSS